MFSGVKTTTINRRGSVLKREVEAGHLRLSKIKLTYHHQRDRILQTFAGVSLLTYGTKCFQRTLSLRRPFFNRQRYFGLRSFFHAVQLRVRMRSKNRLIQFAKNEIQRPQLFWSANSKTITQVLRITYTNKNYIPKVVVGINM